MAETLRQTFDRITLGSFAAYESSIQGYLDDAAADLDPNFYGDRIQRAVSLLAAHMLTRRVAEASGGGGAGAVTGWTQGKISMQFGGVSSVAGSESDLDTTSYGRELRRIMDSIGAGPLWVA